MRPWARRPSYRGVEAVLLAEPGLGQGVELVERGGGMKGGEPLPELARNLHEALDLALVLGRGRAWRSAMMP
jgi:hypothetical protein